MTPYDIHVYSSSVGTGLNAAHSSNTPVKHVFPSTTPRFRTLCCPTLGRRPAPLDLDVNLPIRELLRNAGIGTGHFTVQSALPILIVSLRHLCRWRLYFTPYPRLFHIHLLLGFSDEACSGLAIVEPAASCLPLAHSAVNLSLPSLPRGACRETRVTYMTPLAPAAVVE